MPAVWAAFSGAAAIAKGYFSLSRRRSAVFFHQAQSQANQLTGASVKAGRGSGTTGGYFSIKVHFSPIAAGTRGDIDAS